MENEPKNRCEWFLIVEEYKNSNLTQAEFCRQKDLALAKFVYYLQRYRKQNNIKAQREKPLFSEISISQPIIASANEIKIDLPNGFRCKVPSSISAEVLKKIMGALLSC